MKKIAIVGGGTAGWISACYLNAQLNKHKNGNRAHITLIEPHQPDRIGVGEATIPTLLKTLQVLGIDEREFMRETGATFKQGIKFVNWQILGSHYYHVFDRRVSGTNDNAGLIWAMGDRTESFATAVSSQPTFCEAGLSPKAIGQPNFESPMSYAYHLDAEKFADYLAKKAVTEGVEHVRGKVQQVNQDESLNIVSVELNDQHTVCADLFIDCTGFAAKLIGQALGVDSQDYSPWLLCDSAVTMQIPYSKKQQHRRESYTQSTALSAGWAWDIPLRERRGLGYVYSSQFITDEQAENELKDFEGAHAKTVTCKKIKFKSSRRSVSWKNNCIAIGLSAGFLEPLESTGIYLAEFAAATLCEYFPFGDNLVPAANKFNEIIAQRFEEIVDFIALHYCLSQRTDTPFWREVVKPSRVPQRLANHLSLWATKPCSYTDFHDASQVFGHMNYEYVLYGMGFKYPFVNADLAHLPQQSARTRYVAKEKAMGLQKLPMHDQWLVSELGDGYQLER